MHGPAVASLLAGKTIGVAPDANIYYAAWPSWLEDSRYAADALDWVLEQNEALPEGEKIRVVSVSAAPGSADMLDVYKRQVRTGQGHRAQPVVRRAFGHQRPV